MRKLGKLPVYMLAGVIALSFVGCGSSAVKGTYDGAFTNGVYESAAATEEWSSYDYGFDEAEYESPAESGSTNQETQVNDSARKLIKTYDLDVETEDFDPFVSQVEAKVTQLGGYIENLNSYNGTLYSGKTDRYSYMTLRIPVQNVDAFLGMVGENSNITNQNLYVEDVTLAYVDIESRKAAYEIEQQRLLELLEKAETVEDILTIEDRLTSVRYQLESMGSQLRTYDNLVDYSTIRLNIQEVKKYTEPEVEPESYGQKVWKSFTKGLSRQAENFLDFIVDFVGAVPGIIVFVVVCLIIFFIVRAIVRKCKKKSEARKAAKIASYQAQAAYQMQVNQAGNYNQPQTSENTTEEK